MDSRLNKGDKEVLSLIAVYRILTVNHLAAITQRSRAVIRRRLRFFSSENLIMTRAWGFGRGPGRPEEIIFLTEKGGKILQDEGLFSESIPLIPQKSIDSISVDHDLLINWFYIHLIQIEKSIIEECN